MVMSENIGVVVVSVTGILVIVLSLVPMIAWLSKGSSLSARNDAIRFGGIKASAVIEKIELGGRALGNEFYPAVKLRVLVQNEKKEPYPAQIETTIAVTHMSKFQPGSMIDVAYDPVRPTNVAVLSPTR